MPNGRGAALRGGSEMSATGTEKEPGGVPDGDEALAKELCAKLVELARRAGALRRLHRDEVSGVAQETFRLLWPRVRDEGISFTERGLRQYVYRESDRRRSERDGANPAPRKRGRRGGTAGRAVPPLCPGLAALAAVRPRRRVQYIETLAAAARWAAVAPRGLQARQRRAFELAYEEALPLRGS